MTTSPHTMTRKEKAGKETVKRKRKLDEVAYEILDNDIIFKSGPYLNKSVRQLFIAGPIERDYIVNHLWYTNDEAVVKIINSLCAK